MLSHLRIRNIALIDELEIEFAGGLNLLTGETGSGKSIIVDSLGALTGDRVSSELIKEGCDSGQIEGVFALRPNDALRQAFDEGGVELEESAEVDIVIRRELSLTGKNRVFVNNQVVTQAFLKRIGTLLVDIHGQGEQTALFSPSYHTDILDESAQTKLERTKVAEKFSAMAAVRMALEDLKSDEAQKLQLIDILKFQVEEIGRSKPEPGEDETLEEERRRLSNVEKLSALSGEGYRLLYESEESVISNLERVLRKVGELSDYESSFAEYNEGIKTAEAVLQELAYSLRDFRGGLEFSPGRLDEIETRLAEISRLKRKYGGSIETILAHYDESSSRLKNIESAELRESELLKELKKATDEYRQVAGVLHHARVKAAKSFEKTVMAGLADVALEKARFEVRIAADADDESTYTSKGYDDLEFHFSANVGESVKPLAKVASGGEASRLMLVLKTSAQMKDTEKAVVFDEIDTGVGGRVAEAVGLKLKELAKTQQVLCVTHQPQVAALADAHFTVNKTMDGKKTSVSVKRLSQKERVEEVARMLAGEKITDTARKHARELVTSNK